MLREVVDSSSLRSIGYDRTGRTLEIEFRGGGVYQYDDVPDTVWSELRRSASKGKFFQEHVREHFAVTRVP